MDFKKRRIALNEIMVLITGHNRGGSPNETHMAITCSPITTWHAICFNTHTSRELKNLLLCYRLPDFGFTVYVSTSSLYTR